MNSVLEGFSQDLALQGRTEGTQYTCVGIVRRYIEWAEANSIDPCAGLREDLLAYLAYLRGCKKRQSTLVRIFSALSVWFGYLVEIGELVQNPVPAIQKRYLKKYKDEARQRQLISVEDAAKMVRATIDTRDRAILLLFLKTGIRRNELQTLDVSDIDIPNRSIMLKPTAKRSNRLVFFDDEAARVLARWLVARETRCLAPGETALFTSTHGTRLQPVAIDISVRVAAERVGLHDHASEKLEEKFTPHCCRHWLVTHLLRAGMSREHVKWIRGDAMKEAIDVYYHINPEDVKKSYLMYVPQLGV